MKTFLRILLFLALSLGVILFLFPEKTIGQIDVLSGYTLGDTLDEFNGVVVYYNGSMGNVSGRNTTEDGYNLGLKYQCVEFVKRYYYEVYDHKMPNSYGNAKDFFNPSIEDGNFNKERGLKQFENPSRVKPKVGDICVFGASLGNEFGHVAIISKVDEDEVELIQQNVGTQSRVRYDLVEESGTYQIDNQGILGRLSK